MISLPPNWSWVKLGDVCETTSGGTPGRKNPKYFEGKIPWIKSGELNFNTIRDTEEKITEEAIENSNARLLEKGTLLIALYGATVGRLAFLGIEAATNQAVAAIFTPTNLSNKFLYWFLFSYREQLLKQRIGGAQPNISQGTLRNIPIPFPPLPEQKKIVEKIEELFSHLDSGVASLKKAKEQLRLYRQSVLSFAFSGKLVREVGDGKSEVDKTEMLKAAEPKVKYNNNGLPEDWKWVRVSEICSVVRGGSPRPAGDPKYYDGKIPFLKVRDLTKDSNTYLTTFEYTIKEAGLHKTRKIKSNTLLISNSGATLGVPKICMIDATMNDGIAAFLDLDERSNLYLYYFWLSKTKELRNINMGAAQPNLNTNILKNYLIPYCSFDKQQLVVAEIEKRFSEADNLEKAIDDSLEKSEALRQSILKQAFEGKLVQ